VELHLTPGEEHRLKVSDNRVLRITWVAKTASDRIMEKTT